MSNSVVLKATDLQKRYMDDSNPLQVLKGVNLEIREGECVAIVGASGSGKSTLLQCLGGLDTFDSGEVVVGGENISKLTEKERTRLRNRKLGFVYQFHHLLAEFTALENVAMPLKIRGDKVETILPKVKAVLDSMGLADRYGHLPGQLSGGERQRVAIARAVIGDPLCLLADEPTGNLDSETANSVFSYLYGLSRSRGLAVLIVTHDLDIAQKCDRIIRLKDGRIENAS